MTNCFQFLYIKLFIIAFPAYQTFKRYVYKYLFSRELRNFTWSDRNVFNLNRLSLNMRQFLPLIPFPLSSFSYLRRISKANTSLRFPASANVQLFLVIPRALSHPMGFYSASWKLFLLKHIGNYQRQTENAFLKLLLLLASSSSFPVFLPFGYQTYADRGLSLIEIVRQ